MSLFALKAAHAELQTALAQAIEEVQQDGEGYSNQKQVLAAANDFVDALGKIAGGIDELNRRAALVESICGRWAEYRKAAADAANYPKATGDPEVDEAEVDKWFDLRNEARNVKIALRRLLRGDVPQFLADIDRGVKDISLVLREGNLNRTERTALKNWRERCYKAQEASNGLQTDGCSFLRRLSEVGIFGAQWLCEVKRAAESLKDWASKGDGKGDGKCFYLGAGSVEVNGETITLEENDGVLVEIMLERGTATDGQLKTAGIANPSRALAGLCKRYDGKLAPFIKLPGRRGRGGYQVKIERRYD